MNIRLAFAFIFLACNISFAQQFNFVNFSLNEGLPQSQVTSICQDRSGYLWIGTETGLSKFDGISFTNFTAEDGLADNEIDNIYLDHDFNLWVATPKGLSKIENNEIVTYPFSEDLLTEYNVNDLVQFNDDLLLATDQGIVCFKENKYHVINYEDEQVAFRAIVNYNNKTAFCASKSGLFTYSDNRINKLNHEKLANLNLSDLVLVDSSLYISTYGDGLIKYNLIDQELIEYKLPIMRIRSLHVLGGSILCATKNGAIELNEETGKIYLYNNSNGLYFENIRTVFIDREQNCWIGSDGKGLFKLTGKSIVTYTKSHGIYSNAIMGIHQNKAGVFAFSTYESGVTFWANDSTFVSKNYNDQLKNSTVWMSWNNDDGSCWVASSGGVDLINSSGTIEKSINLPTTKMRAILPYNDSTIFFGGASGLFVLNNKKIDTLFSSYNLDINKIINHENHIYLATTTGLYYFNFNTDIGMLEFISLPENNVKSIAFDLDFNLWIGTNSKGIFVKTKDNDFYPFILDQEDAGSRTVLGVIVSSKNDIWVSTLNGVYQIMHSSDVVSDYKIYHYGYAEGLITLECNQNALYEDNQNHIWVGTSDGLVEINPDENDQMFRQRKPELLITGIRLFMEDFDYRIYSSEIDKITGVPTTINLPYNKNHLTFDFVGINLKDPHGVRYQYRLLGAEENWSPLTPNRYATYSFIGHGEYDFEVRSVNATGQYSETKRIHVSISPPFWLTWWFILFVVLIGLIIIWGIFQIRIRAIKQKEENEKLGYKNRLLFLEQQSLNASMNRHFIFNSLNSIQYFINSSNKLAANKYLTSFAKLIRKNLDSSQANNFIVTMKEEIERIELYLSLEKMRFEGKFDYQIIIDEEIDQESIEMPSMILQPFVENSIIHGVLPVDRKGQIILRGYMEFDYLIFEIEDDGIGIDESLARKNKKSDDHHESMGMEITNRRIELLRKLTGENLMLIGPFQINNSKGEVAGTKVIIKIFVGNQID